MYITGAPEGISYSIFTEKLSYSLTTRATGIAVESVPQMMAFHPWSRDNNTIRQFVLLLLQ